MAHIMSMVTEGVFERFPTLKVVLYEGGVFWLPHIMWRFDKNWKAQRSETPWVKQAPSRYILDHFYSTTYPLEAAPDPKYLHQVLEMIEAERTLLFSSSYPNWALGDPFEMIRDVPEALLRARHGRQRAWPSTASACSRRTARAVAPSQHEQRTSSRASTRSRPAAARSCGSRGARSASSISTASFTR